MRKTEKERGGERPTVDAATARASSGFPDDQSALGIALEDYRPQIRAVVNGLVGRRTEINSEDVVQEVLIKAWLNRGKFQGRSTFKTWLYKIAVNAALDALKKTRRKIVSLDAVTDNGPNGAKHLPELAAHPIDFDAIILVHQLVNRLSPSDAAIVKLHGELPEDVGHVLGIGTQAARKRMYRALDRLRTLVGETKPGDLGKSRKPVRRSRARGTPGAAAKRN